MAVIGYNNVTLPVGGLGFIPAFEEVLDTTPAVSMATSGYYELTNNNGGSFNGFKIQFASNLNDFTYGPDGKPSGTITFVYLRAPDGTYLASAGPGATGFGNQKLQDFYAALTNSNAPSPKDAIFAALDSLFSKSNAMNGSNVADHLTAYGTSAGELFGNGGDDVLWSRKHYDRKLVGGDGNDIIRVEKGTYEVHGGNADGTGGAGTDTLEIVGYVNSASFPEFKKLTNIDVLRFVAGDQPPPGSINGATIGAYLELSNIGIANLPSALSVHGSSSASPLSTNAITIFAGYDPAATGGVTINLSGWTFKTWNEERNTVYITTNTAQKALKDVVIGTRVADEIYTRAGDDTIRGGGGADRLYGGDGNDIFVYGFKEAIPGEIVHGGTPELPPVMALAAQAAVADGIDTVLVLGDNNFSGTTFVSIERLKFGGKATATFEQDIVGNPQAVIIGDGNANTVAVQLKNTGGKVPGVDLSGLTFQNWTDGVDKVIVKGTKSQDIITGSSRGDVIIGGEGRDSLQGGAGADAFVFDTGKGKGVDLIADFSRKQGDMIWLELDVFAKLGKAVSKGSGVLKKSAFEIGRKADDKKDRILYDKKTGTLRYDDDGSGKHKAHVIAVLDDSPALKAGDIFVI